MKQPNINVSFKGNRIEQVEQFKYLESIISNDGRSEKEIRNRIGQVKKAFLLQSKILISKNVSVETRKRLIKTYIRNTVLYKSETWALNKKDEKILEVFEMWCWRKLEK